MEGPMRQSEELDFTPADFRKLEQSILTYLDQPAKAQKVLEKLLLDCGLLELVIHGLSRILLEKVPPKDQAQFFKDYLCLKNWAPEEAEELEEEWHDLTVDVHELTEEKERLEKEYHDMLNPPPKVEDRPESRNDKKGKKNDKGKKDGKNKKAKAGKPEKNDGKGGEKKAKEKAKKK